MGHAWGKDHHMGAWGHAYGHDGIHASPSRFFKIMP